jgi:hypothetical protein
MKTNQRWMNGIMAAVMVIVLVGTLAGCATIGGGKKSPLVGSWTLSSDWGGGKTWEPILVVNPDLTGTLEDVEAGMSSDLSNVVSEGNAVSFSCTSGGAMDFEISFEGTVTSDAIEGEFITDVGNATVTGVRN